jgi:hypothetical protein
VNDSVLDLRNRAREIQELYPIDDAIKFSALVMGLRGVGKTTLLGTAPYPLLVDSFDPNGTVVLQQMYPEECRDGRILIRKWWGDRAKRPRVFKAWEKQFEIDLQSGFFDALGTYAIDSYTMLQDVLSNCVGMTGKSAKLDIGALAMADYQALYATVKDIINMASNCDCNFIMTAHTVADKDELTGEVTIDIDAYRKLRTSVPLLFTEKYVLIKETTSAGAKHILLTQDFKRYQASTQIGAGGIFTTKEEPNIKMLLKKAGMSDADKPSLIS